MPGNDDRDEVDNRTKVERYQDYKFMRDQLPGGNERTTKYWARAKYEDLTFKMMMTKPSERDWQEHLMALLKREYK